MVIWSTRYWRLSWGTTMKYECCVTPYLANRIPTPVNIRFSHLDNPGARPTPQFAFSAMTQTSRSPELR